MFYKFKMLGNHWFIMFSKNGENTFIYDDIDALRSFICENKAEIFISGENYNYDNKMIESLIGIDINTFPVSLDVTQEIVGGNNVKLDNCLANMNRKVFNYNISDDLSDEDLSKVIEELTYKIDFIKELYSKRIDYFEWRLGLIKEYGLPIESLHYSSGKLMEEIVSFNGNKMNSICIDPNLQKYIDSMPEVKKLADRLINTGINGQTVEFGDVLANISGFGLKSSCDNLCDTSGDNNYLYIDFNSFGPSIIINNGWLNELCDYPERYREVRDRRIDLKAKKDKFQSYYKGLINEFIGYIASSKNDSYDKNLVTSQVINGVLVIYTLYKLIEKYDVDVIEINTDGMIIKSHKKHNESIKYITQKMCKDLNMSCDVDVIKKIVHRNMQNYCVEFDDGSIKTIGAFNSMEKEMFKPSGKIYLSDALVDYYLNDKKDIMDIINSLVQKNDPVIFQELINKTSKSAPIYTCENGEIVELTSSVTRVVAVKDESKKPLYKKNSSGKLVPYNSKVKFEVVNDGLDNFDMSRLDLNYYFNEVKRNIVATSGRKVAMVDIDGTLVEDQDRKEVLIETLNEMKINMSEEEINYLDGSLGWAYLEFMSTCKKEKAHGNVETFALAIKNKCSRILGEDFDYVRFANIYLKEEEKQAERDTKVFSTVEEGINKLKCQGYDISIYTNGLPLVQKAKLKHLSFVGDIIHVGDLSNSYAKSSVKGYTDQLEQLKVKTGLDEVIMIGNGSSDVVPKTLNIPTFILLNGRSVDDLSKKIRNCNPKDGVYVVEDMVEVAKTLSKGSIKKQKNK